MRIETKYEPGQLVYFLNGREIVIGKVKSFMVTVPTVKGERPEGEGKWEVKVTYDVATPAFVNCVDNHLYKGAPEDVLYDSPEALSAWVLEQAALLRQKLESAGEGAFDIVKTASSASKSSKKAKNAEQSAKDGETSSDSSAPEGE